MFKDVFWLFWLQLITGTVKTLYEKTWILWCLQLFTRLFMIGANYRILKTSLENILIVFQGIENIKQFLDLNILQTKMASHLPSFLCPEPWGLLTLRLNVALLYCRWNRISTTSWGDTRLCAFDFTFPARLAFVS